MTLEELRNQIDQSDRDITDAFIRRMKAVEEIGLYKAEHSLEIEHPHREAEIIASLEGLDYNELLVKLYKYILELSKDYQRKVIK